MAPSEADSLTILLATESFLLAAVSVALGMKSPTRKFVSLIRVPSLLVSALIIVVTICVAFGAVTGWSQTYAGGAWTFSSGVVSTAIFVAIVGQALLTVLLALEMIEAS